MATILRDEMAAGRVELEAGYYRLRQRSSRRRAGRGDAMTTCAECGAEIPHWREQQPCSKCGALNRNYDLNAALGEYAITGSPVSLQVERAITEARMTALALILGTALSVGLAVGFATCLLYGFLAFVAAALGTALLLAAIYRVGAVRRFAMELMHRITGQ